MKIIAERREGIRRVLIAELSETEAARLIGSYSEHSLPSGVTLKPGDEIKIDAMYDRLRNLHTSAESIGGVVGTLRKLACELEPMQPVVKALIEATAPSSINWP